MLPRNFITLGAICVSLVSVACSSRKATVRLFGPEVRSDLVIFFNQDVTHQQIEDFWRDILSKPDLEGRGHPLRDGVGNIARNDAVQGHEGISVSFFATASQAQKEAVERDVRSSPIVYKVLNDTAPADVKNIE